MSNSQSYIVQLRPRCKQSNLRLLTHLSKNVEKSQFQYAFSKFGTITTFIGDKFEFFFSNQTLSHDNTLD